MIPHRDSRTEPLPAGEGPTETIRGDAISGAGAPPPEFTTSQRFAVQRRLGSGGFGVVYQVYDRLRDAVLALKTLTRVESRSLSQFKREFRTLADFSHGNLVALYELLSQGEQWFFTMEYIEGVHFLKYLRTGGDRFSRLRLILRQLAEGVNALHQFGVLHCDLKPHNVLISPQGHLTILDFGLVTDAFAAETTETERYGTPEYMSPEQVAGHRASPASDWYSVGVMLYEALTGDLPFSGPRASILRDKLEMDAVPVRQIRPDAPRDLCDLAGALLQRDPSLRPPGIEILRRLGATATAEIRVKSREHARFAGRERELATLHEALRAAQQGRQTTALIHGPSGVGKSALVRHFLDDVREQKAYLVLDGRCHERESVPYKALDSLVDNLNRWLLNLPRAERQDFLPCDFEALARLFPVLRDLAQEAIAVQMPNAAELRLRGFRVLREMLTRIAARNPVVLVIDDLQWGDTDSAALIRDLFSSHDPLPILFVACYRSEEAGTSPILQQLLSDPASAGNRIDLPLEALDHGTARDLALSLLNRDEPGAQSLADGIASESAGNPFFIGELAGYSRSLTGGQAGAAEPVSLDELVRRRLAGLPEDSRRLLEVIAIAGQPIELTTAKAAAGLASGAYLELARLRRQSLVRTRTTEASEKIEAYHDRIRQGAERSLSPEALRTCHHRLATAGESVGPPDPGFLAIHFHEAGLPAKAFGYSIRAAGDAAAALAFDAAARFYRMAVESAPGEAQRKALSVLLGDALCNAGRGAEGAGVYLQVAAGRADEEGVDLRRRAAAQFLMAGRIEEGLPLFHDLLAGFRLRVPTATWQSVLPFFLRRLWLRLRGLSFRERDAAQIPAIDLLRIDTCASLVQGLSMVDPPASGVFHGRLLALTLRAGEPRRLSLALCVEAGYLALAGGRNKVRVDRVLSLARDLADRSLSENALGMVALVNGVSTFLRGEWKLTFERMTRAESILRERCTGVAWEVATAHMMGSVSLFQMGEIKLLSHRLPRIIQDAEARGDLFEATDLRTRLAHVICLAADNPGRAHDEIRAAKAAWRREDFDLQHWWAWIGSVETDLYSGDSEQAWMRIRSEWPKLRWSFLTRVQYVHLESLHHRARAALAMAAEESAGPALRRRLLHRAESDAANMARRNAPWANALVVLLRAGIAARRGAREQTVKLLESAEGRLFDVDMILYAMAARRTRGRLLEGEQGRELVSSADEWMRDQEILNPERMSGALAPGFWANHLDRPPDVRTRRASVSISSGAGA